jgi:hypothetical protein
MEKNTLPRHKEAVNKDKNQRGVDQDKFPPRGPFNDRLEGERDIVPREIVKFFKQSRHTRKRSKRY